MTETVNDDARIEQTYDLNGRVVSITTTGVAGSSQPTTTATYGYDTTGKTVAQTTIQGRTGFDYDARRSAHENRRPDNRRVHFLSLIHI